MISNPLSEVRIRILLLGFLMFLGIALLAGKLYHEQIFRGDRHRERISKQSVRRIRIPAKRGKIFTRELLPVVDNRPGCTILLYPEEMRRPGRRSRTLTIDYITEAAEAIARKLGREVAVDKKDVTRHLNLSPGLPIILYQGLTVQEAAPALELSRIYDGIGMEEDETREYQGTFAAHLIGYTGRDNPRAAADRQEFFYYVPDLIGRAGLEALCDGERTGDDGNAISGLLGSPGHSLVQVDNLGFVHNAKLEYRPPVDGNHLILTLDRKAQQLAESALSGLTGAFVLLNADTGEVLAMASAPTYDLRNFSPRVDPKYYRQLLNDPGKPLLNRVLNGTYTPGSILKPLIAMAILADGVDPLAKVDCTGRAAVGTGKISCAATYGHGMLDLFEAIERSCNVYFIERGMAVGQKKIEPVLRSAGLGKRTGLELRDNLGIFPSVEAKRRFYKSRWNIFDTAMLSIGQGIITITPLQAAVYTAAIANGGKVMRPYLTARIVDQRGGTLWHNEPEVRGELQVSPEHLEMVHRGMFQVVNAPEGSGKRAKNDAITLYGKTGSAEVGSGSNRHKNTWFIAFGTARGTRYAAVMMVERGASGGTTCANRVGDFFKQYLSGGTR